MKERRTRSQAQKISSRNERPPRASILKCRRRPTNMLSSARRVCRSEAYSRRQGNNPDWRGERNQKKMAQCSSWAVLAFPRFQPLICPRPRATQCFVSCRCVLRKWESPTGVYEGCVKNSRTVFEFIRFVQTFSSPFFYVHAAVLAVPCGCVSFCLQAGFWYYCEVFPLHICNGCSDRIRDVLTNYPS